MAHKHCVHYLLCCNSHYFTSKNKRIVKLWQTYTPSECFETFPTCCMRRWCQVRPVCSRMLGNIWRAYGSQYNLWLWDPQCRWPSPSPVKTSCASHSVTHINIHTSTGSTLNCSNTGVDSSLDSESTNPLQWSLAQRFLDRDTCKATYSHLQELSPQF